MSTTAGELAPQPADVQPVAPRPVAPQPVALQPTVVPVAVRQVDVVRPPRVWPSFMVDMGEDVSQAPPAKRVRVSDSMTYTRERRLTCLLVTDMGTQTE
jgi:hypothetical protein